eukprot:141584-Prymnesium_polylepis.1
MEMEASIVRQQLARLVTCSGRTWYLQRPPQPAAERPAIDRICVQLIGRLMQNVTCGPNIGAYASVL